MGLGCGGETRTLEAPLISVEEERARAEPPKGPKQVSRAELERALEAGLGGFLRHVSVEAALVNGSFQGFRIVELRPQSAWEGVDLRPGDIVTEVNGQSIERPEQAHAVFVGLKEMDRVVVSYLRDGKAHELVIPIIDPEPKAPAGAGPARDL